MLFMKAIIMGVLPEVSLNSIILQNKKVSQDLNPRRYVELLGVDID